jgi:hypothetical protein
MTRPTKLRTGLLAALAVSLAGSGGLVAVGLGAGGPDPPNLQPYLPTDSSRHVSRFMDTIQEPGHTLVRFDTVLENVSTSPNARLDLYRTAAGQPTEQKIWGLADRLDTPSADAAPVDQSNSVALPDAYRFFYFPKPGHFHFHFPHAADYQLTTDSGQVIADSPKNAVGFCLFDSYSQGGAFATDPCHAGEPDYTGPIRMGISPGSGDLYFAGLTDQWVDVTDVMPGEYQIKATADPDGVIRESDEGDNVKFFPITVAGAAPADAARTTAAGTPVDVPLSATVYGADVPRRVAPPGSGCDGPNADLVNPGSPCFDWTHASTGQATFTVTGATGGTAAIVDPSGTAATLRFTPAPGFSGTATVRYTATDSRGLTSPPATATITVTPAPGRVSSTPPGGSGPTTTTPPKSGHFTLSAAQLLINQRIGQAAIRRLNAVAATLDGRPTPTPPTAHKRGTVTLSAAQLLINQRIYQAAIRRAAALEARLDHKPAPTAGSGHGGVVRLTLGQLIINQRIAQAGVRRANALVARVS